MKTVVLCVVAALFAVACGSSDAVYVGGTVHGLWDGVDGVALQLMTGRVDTLLTVPANGGFQFPLPLAPGASYVVAVANNPLDHTCVVHNGNGVVANDGVYIAPDVACVGPSVSIAVAGIGDTVFDPSQEQQTFAGSPLVDSAALVIDAAPGITAQLDGARVVLGAPMPETFAIGATSFDVAFAAPRGLSKTFHVEVDRGGAPAAQTLYGKAADASMHHGIGTATALDGDTLVVATASVTLRAQLPAEPGAVYVFVRRDGGWSQQAKIPEPATPQAGAFASAVAISGDTLVISDLDGLLVYTRSGVAWTLSQRLTVASPVELFFDGGLAIHDDVVVAGVPGQTVDGIRVAGAAYVFRRTGATWNQEAMLAATTAREGLYFGGAVAISGDTVAISAAGTASPQDVVPDQAVYVYRGAASQWTLEQIITVPPALPASHVIGFGTSLALAGDTLAIGSPYDKSRSSGIDGDELATGMAATGAVYVYARDAGRWQRQAFIKPVILTTSSGFGTSLAVIGDVLAVGAPGDSGIPQIDLTDSSLRDSGAVFLFGRTGATWKPVAYQKAAQPRAGDEFGFSIAMSADTLAVGSPLEDGSGAGLDATGQGDAGAPDSGALYLFH